MNRQDSSTGNTLALAANLLRNQNWGEAEQLLQELLRSKPRNFDAVYLLAVIHAQRGQIDAAAQLFRKAAAINPDSIDANYNLSVALGALRRFEDVIKACDRVLKVDPRHVNALNNRALAAFELGYASAALVDFDRLIELAPRFSSAYDNRGLVLKALRRLGEALDDHDAALHIAPDNPKTLSNRGIVLREMGRIPEAIESYDRAIAINPNLAEVHNNRGQALKISSAFSEATESFRRALALDPNHEFLRGEFLHMLLHIGEWQGFDTACNEMFARLQHGETACSPFILLTLTSSAELQLTTARNWIRTKHPFNGSQHIRRHGTRKKDDRIRLGYFSADFHSHATAHLMAEVFENHDKSKFELFAFSFGPTTNDEMQTRIKNTFDTFLDVRDASDIEIAKKSAGTGH